MIRVSEYLPFHIWTVNFLERQGYDLDRKILYLDNLSAKRFKKNEETHAQETLDMLIYDIFL